MNKDIVELKEDLSASDLYSEDLAPVPAEKRTWSMWHLAALWVGMAVCIPTYLLASYMIGDGMNWIEALSIIGLANIIITVPMVLNGHAGVKYGIPFPVIGRSSFGINGIHIAAIIRAVVACGWFGVNTWIGGLALYAIFNTITGADSATGLSFEMFVGFALFWLINLYFIWKGTESIKWLEQYAAPILIFMGIFLIGWGASQAGGFGIVLKQSKQLETPTVYWDTTADVSGLVINSLTDKHGQFKANQFRLYIDADTTEWLPLNIESIPIPKSPETKIMVQVKNDEFTSSKVAPVELSIVKRDIGFKLRLYLKWLTAMLGFWATMSLSIADITRYASSQKDQATGQFIGLPASMMLYSFVGIFVTCAALINFEDILIRADAPWDPVSLLAKFDNPVIVIISQLFMLVATLSTNIAANVIAPANAFSNLNPKKISFRTGGIITAILGIVFCPWWIMEEIKPILIDVSAILGPVLGIMICDYYWIRRKTVNLGDLYRRKGSYSYSYGYNIAAILAFVIGVSFAGIGKFVESLRFLYDISWFTGFIVSFFLYYLLMRKNKAINVHTN